MTLSLALAVAAGCGGGGGDGGTGAAPPPATGSPPPPANDGQAGVVMGPITGFGSVFVNGVKFETGEAEITIDGSPGSEAELEIGDMVTVTGTVDDDGLTGSAASISADDNVEGPIDAIDPAVGTLTVLGQTVLVTDTTSFDDGISPRSLDGLAVGDIVEVSGLVRASGEIVATRIERKPAGGELEVKGVVADHDAAALRFRVNALTVDYSAAAVDDFPGGVIADGDLVEVKGTSFGAGGELMATRVQRENALEMNDGDELEIEGFITRFASPADFDVAGHAVTTTDRTLYENGGAADLGLNVKVEVEGAVDAAGVLVARKVSIRRANTSRIAAPIQALDAGAGTLTVLGVSVVVDALTRVEDHSAAGLERASLADLSVGDFVEIRGAEDPPESDVVRAARLQREDPEAEVELQGLVDQVSEPTLVILGVTVQTDGATEYRDESDRALTAAGFFGRVAVGSPVKAKGADAGGTLMAEEVEFELED